MRRALLGGTFTTANLFGFWLPLYQFVCAIVSAFVGSPFYVPKLVSAASGAGVCLMVFLFTRELTANRFLSLASFAAVAVNPYHILYSASAMTDVPHAFFILLCGYCCIRDRWLLAALFGLAAITLEEVTATPRKQPRDSIVLYRVHTNEVASKR
jgi:predicted membrane-bound dolichyl-phosphate-mannose-protein mannosyltransferase